MKDRAMDHAQPKTQPNGGKRKGRFACVESGPQGPHPHAQSSESEGGSPPRKAPAPRVGIEKAEGARPAEEARSPPNAFLEALQCQGESDVRGHLFQFLHLADIVRLSSLSRAWRTLGLERDIRSVCASLPPHLTPPYTQVSDAALKRFLCKVRGFTTFLSQCTNLRTVQVAMSDFYLHPEVDKALTKLFECLGRMERLRILSLLNYSHSQVCEERFFDTFFNYLLSVRRGGRVFRQLEELYLRMGNNCSIKNVHRLFGAAERRAFSKLRGLTLDYQSLGPGARARETPWLRAVIEAAPCERDVGGCLRSLPLLENLKIHGPGAGSFFHNLGAAPCRLTLRHLDLHSSSPSYLDLAKALGVTLNGPDGWPMLSLDSEADTDLPALRTLRVDALSLWAILPALHAGKCAKLTSLRVQLPHRDIDRPLCVPLSPNGDVAGMLATFADPFAYGQVHSSLHTGPCVSITLRQLLTDGLASLLASPDPLPNLTRLKVTLGRQQAWGLIRDRSTAEQIMEAARTGGRARRLMLELQEAFVPPGSLSASPVFPARGSAYLKAQFPHFHFPPQPQLPLPPPPPQQNDGLYYQPLLQPPHYHHHHDHDHDHQAPPEQAHAHDQAPAWPLL